VVGTADSQFLDSGVSGLSLFRRGDDDHFPYINGKQAARYTSSDNFLLDLYPNSKLKSSSNGWIQNSEFERSLRS
jgi:hypothetical protein